MMMMMLAPLECALETQHLFHDSMMRTGRLSIRSDKIRLPYVEKKMQRQGMAKTKPADGKEKHAELHMHWKIIIFMPLLSLRDLLTHLEHLEHLCCPHLAWTSSFTMKGPDDRQAVPCADDRFHQRSVWECHNSSLVGLRHLIDY